MFKSASLANQLRGRTLKKWKFLFREDLIEGMFSPDWPFAWGLVYSEGGHWRNWYCFIRTGAYRWHFSQLCLAHRWQHFRICYSFGKLRWGWVDG